MLGEELVVAIGGARVVQAHQEQAGGLALVDQRTAVADVEHAVAERRRQPVQHRGAQHEVLQFRGLAREHILGEEVGDLAEFPVEALQHLGLSAVAPQRHAEQLQAHRPPFGARVGHCQLVVRELAMAIPGQEGDSLRQAEAEVVGLDLGDLSLGPQPAERQSEVLARGEGQPEFGRRGLQQNLQTRQRRRILQMLGVIHEQIHRRLAVYEGVGGCNDHQPGRRAAFDFQQLEEPRLDRAAGLFKCAKEVADEQGGLPVGSIQAQPGHRGAARRQPGSPLLQQAALAVAGGRLDQPELRVADLFEPLDQSRAVHERLPGRANLGAAIDARKLVVDAHVPRLPELGLSGRAAPRSGLSLDSGPAGSSPVTDVSIADVRDPVQSATYLEDR